MSELELVNRYLAINDNGQVRFERTNNKSLDNNDNYARYDLMMGFARVFVLKSELNKEKISNVCS